MQQFRPSLLEPIDDSRDCPPQLQQDFDLGTCLQHIKVLFVGKKHRQCLHLCESTLSEASQLMDRQHLLYLHFYIASAHDDLARQMYDLSRFKSSRFALAEQHYDEALRIICELEHRPTYSLPREASSISLLSAISDWSMPKNEGHLESHLRKMKEQILTHLSMTEKAKKGSEAALAKRQRVQSLNSPLNTPSPAGRLQSSKSYWSFTPEAAKTSEKQFLIQDGRARGWTRDRFQPGRYRILAEMALEEL